MIEGGTPDGAHRDEPAPADGVASTTSRTLEQREREIARLSRLYAALSEVNQVIVRVSTREELFERICRVLGERGGFRMAWVGWLEPQTSELLPVAHWGDEVGYLQRAKVYVDERPEGSGPSGKAFREGRPFYGNDILNDPSAQPWRAELELAGLRASAAFPIREQGQVSGTLSVYADEPGFFRERELELLAETAADISFALDNLSRDTARQRAERTLRHERDFSDAVLSSLPGVLYLYDRAGKFLRWNRNFEQATGYTAAEISNMHPLDFFGGPDSEQVRARINEVFEKGQSNVEAGLVSKSGGVTPYHFTGLLAPIDGRDCLVGVGIDITEQKRAEEARRASEARYLTLFEYAPDGIVIADPQSYYIDANPSICRMLGYAREELVGLHASAIVVASDLPNIEPALETIKAHANYHEQWQFRRKDGSVFPAEVRATLMPDGNLLGMIRDVTERKVAEAALRESRDTLEVKVAARTEELQRALVRAEEADRVKSAFLATMSHELRTPLNSIIGFTGIVLQGMAGPLTAEQAKQLGMVRGSARHLLALINDVLDLSKIEADQLEVRAEPFDLCASLENVLASVRPMAEKKGLSLVSSVSAELGQMVSDRRRVEQILINLLSNAVKFTERGHVALRASLREELQATAPGAPRRFVRLEVEDTGMGIRSEDLASLFQPFRQLDTGLSRQHDGTGLGLAICKRLTTLVRAVRRVHGHLHRSRGRARGATLRSRCVHHQAAGTRAFGGSARRVARQAVHAIEHAQPAPRRGE